MPVLKPVQDRHLPSRAPQNGQHSGHLVGRAITAGVALVSAGTALALITLQGPGPDHDLAPALESVQTELGELRRANEALGEHLAGLANRVEAVAAAAARTTMPEIGDAQLERVLAGVLEAGAFLSPTAEREDTPELDLASIFPGLLGTNPDQAQDIWTQIKDAGRIDELLEMFAEHARLNPNLAQAHVDLGNAYLQKLVSMTPGPQQGEVAMRADRAFDGALQVDPNHWEARFTKAVAFTFWPDFLGKKQQAIDQFEILITQQEQGASQPHFAQTYLFLGNLYEQRGQAEKAAEIWANGLGFFPADAELRSKVK